MKTNDCIAKHLIYNTLDQMKKFSTNALHVESLTHLKIFLISYFKIV